MAKRTTRAVLPYLTPSKDRIHAAAWINEEGLTLGDALEAWDYNSRITLARKVIVDTFNICGDCGLGHGAVFRLSVTILSKGSGVRTRCFHQDIYHSKSPEQVSIQSDIGNTSLTGSAVVTTLLTLVSSGGTLGDFSPTKAGSMLWRDDHEILLEGGGSKFPMEVVDFQATGWLPEDAPWYLDWEPDFLDHPFMGSVRLLINAAHERMMKAVSSNMPDNEDQAILSTLYYDTGRSLIEGALENQDFVDDVRDWPEGSTARVLADLLSVFFPGESYTTLKHRMSGDAEVFGATLRGRFRLFGYQAGD
jgi:hypothetical protein